MLPVGALVGYFNSMDKTRQKSGPSRTCAREYTVGPTVLGKGGGSVANKVI